jgi:hypothetical protein
MSCRQSPPEPPVPQQTAAEKHRQAILKRYEHLLVSLESKEPMKSLVDVLFEKEPVAVDHMWKAFLKEARLSMLAIAKNKEHLYSVVTQETMENFGFDQYLAACPPRIREFLEAG